MSDKKGIDIVHALRYPEESCANKEFLLQEAADTIEHLRYDLRRLHCPTCDSFSSMIDSKEFELEQAEKRIAELEQTLGNVIADLELRADPDSEGLEIVGLSGLIYLEAKQKLKGK